MSKRPVTATVIAEVYRAPAKENKLRLSLDVDPSANFHKGDLVEVRRVLTDEIIGRRLRDMLDVEERRGRGRMIAELAQSIQDEAGWPILADLIRDIAEELKK